MWRRPRRLRLLQHPSDFWQTRPFLAYLFNESPIKDQIVVNDRWGNECRGAHGGVYTCENGGFSDWCSGNRTTHPWFYWATQARSWGFSRTEDASAYRGPGFFVPLLVNTVATGGSLMLNFGPASDGTIPVIQQRLLDQMGDWLDSNGVGVFNTTWRRRGQFETVGLSKTIDEVETGQNNVMDVPVAGNTSDINYFGKTADYQHCGQLCVADSTCRSYTFHDNTTGDYANMCYGINSSRWTLVPEAGHVSGRKTATDVTYTVSTVDKDVLYAFFEGFPSGQTIHLTSPVCTAAAASAEVLGVDKHRLPVAVAAAKPGESGVDLVLPVLQPGVLSPGIVYGVKLVGFV